MYVGYINSSLYVFAVPNALLMNLGLGIERMSLGTSLVPMALDSCSGVVRGGQCHFRFRSVASEI